MSAIPFVKASVASLKNALRDEFPEIGSAHLSEALAAALGYRTQVALRAALPDHDRDPTYVLLDNEAFDDRISTFGHVPDLGFSFDLLDLPALLNTTCKHAWNINYKSMRDKAWRNIIVSAVNEGLRRRVFSLKADDNRWEGWSESRGSGTVYSATFDFTLDNGLPVKAYVADAGFGELAINVAVCPTDQANDFVGAYEAGFAAGEAFAAAWIERERGAWIQSATSSLKCRKALLEPLSSMIVRPAGYGDRGRVIM